MNDEILFDLFWRNNMKYYRTWQDALRDFISRYGHNYRDAYNMITEFELILQRNIRGVYFMEDE